MGGNGHDHESIKASLRAFISEPMMPLTRVSSFEDDDSFMEMAILDSTGVLELVGHIEKRFEIRVESDEITPDNLDSLNKLAAFIERKTENATQ